jgi:nucleoside-diphosphate-sugar epimerase
MDTIHQLLAHPKVPGRSALVTGGAGFIGSHLVRALLAQGLSVRVLDDLSSGHLANVPEGAEFVFGTVEDADQVHRLMSGCEHVFHLAAMVSVPQSVADPEGSFRINVIGTENVIRAATNLGVRSMVNTSSAAIYGPRPSLPSRETDPILCVSPYAAGKAAGEMLLQSAVNSAGLHAVSLRLFNVFGIRQDPKSAYAAAISAFVDSAVARRAPLIFGTGRQTRDFVPVSNVVQAFLRAAASDRSVSGRAFNVGLGIQTTLLEVVERIAEFSGFSAPPEMRPRRAGDVNDSVANITAIREALAYEPTVTVAEGLRELVSFGLLARS